MDNGKREQDSKLGWWALLHMSRVKAWCNRRDLHAKVTFDITRHRFFNHRRAEASCAFMNTGSWITAGTGIYLCAKDTQKILWNMFKSFSEFFRIQYSKSFVQNYLIRRFWSKRCRKNELFLFFKNLNIFDRIFQVSLVHDHIPVPAVYVPYLNLWMVDCKRFAGRNQVSLC